MDQNQELPSAEMALALYAATAATMCVRALQSVRVFDDDKTELLIQTLMACRAASGMSPRIEVQVDLLLDLLLGSGLPE